MSVNKKKEYVLQELKEQGYRITSQRKLIIEIIVQNECSSCKEIHNLAMNEDPSIGLATVYRMVRALEEMELIKRRSPYCIDYV